MAVCNYGHRPSDALFGSPCQSEAEPGRKRCAYHLDQQNAAWRKRKEKLRALKLARPDWMSDPSLLPKRPPGAK